MFAHERHQEICHLLQRSRRLTVEQLLEKLGASPATLRRDLAELEAAGKVVRVRGAVVHPSWFQGEPTLAQKSRAAAGSKRDIAAVAAELVPSGASVLIDAGTTCLAFGRLLLSRNDITIWTHSLPLAALAQETNAAAQVVCIGGRVRAVSGALVGALALSWLENLRVDWAFAGASGLSPDGVSTTEISEAATKTALLRRASHKVLLADGRKWNKPAAVQFASWNEFDFWITDTDAGRVLKTTKLRVVNVRDEKTRGKVAHNRKAQGTRP